MLPLDDLGGDDVVLEVRASRTVPGAGKSKQARTTNKRGRRIRSGGGDGVRARKNDDDEKDTGADSCDDTNAKCAYSLKERDETFATRAQRNVVYLRTVSRQFGSARDDTLQAALVYNQDAHSTVCVIASLSQAIKQSLGQVFDLDPPPSPPPEKLNA